MNALRQIVNASNGLLSIQLPAAYHGQQLEVIILPFEEGVYNKKNEQQLAQAHQLIDAGGGENLSAFLVEFEQSRQDRVLPFRD